jgi:type I restriction enzyme S subunit
MKHNWKETQLSELLQLNVDSVDVNSQPEFHFAGVYCFGNGLFEKGYLNGDTSYKTFNRLHKNQIVVSKVKGWEGAIAQVTEEFEGMFLSPVYPTFELISDEKANLKFIHYFLKQEHVWQQLLDKSVGIGARRNSVSEAQFLKLTINLPKLETQNKIISSIESIKSQLDELQKLRIEQDKEMNNLRYSLMCSLENEYSKERIDEVCDLKKGSFPIMKTDAGEFPFVVTAAEFKTANVFDFDCEATCVPLVSSTGHGNAAMHRVHYASGKFALSNLLCAVMPKDKEIVNAKYLYELFMAKKDEYFVPIMAGTSNVSLNTGKLGSVEIPIPPIEEQNRIVELLEKINEIKQTHKEQEAELKQLMPSLLDKAFKGEL